MQRSCTTTWATTILTGKDVAKAKEYFNKYLELDPNNEAYRKFVEGLE